VVSWLVCSFLLFFVLLRSAASRQQCHGNFSIAGIVAITALILAILAFDRSYTEVSDDLQVSKHVQIFSL
jgi:hypothetical protein